MRVYTLFSLNSFVSTIALMVFILPSAIEAGEKDLSKKPITVAEVKAAQKAWCDGLIKIGKIYEKKGNYKKFAKDFIAETYDYENGKVFFRPTLAVSPRAFRKTAEGALAYFVGGNPKYPEDKGFALAPWVKVGFDSDEERNGIQIHGNIAVVMGNVYLTDKAGNEIKVDKTFVFRRCEDGKLRLIAHKSALPNMPSE